MKHIGILAIQGDFEKHRQILQKLGYRAEEIRTDKELDQSDALIIPGGESTTFMRLLHDFNLVPALKKFAGEKPVFGTCAGCIILASDVDQLPFPPLAVLKIKVQRNAYGRQRESFVGDVHLDIPGYKEKYEGVFIRAPKIETTVKEIKVLARYKDDIVMVASGRTLVCTFHPELTTDTVIHKYFLDEFVT